jgi:hypothetical protein
MLWILLAIALIPVIYYAYRGFDDRSSSFKPELKENAELMKVLLGLEEKPLNDLFALYKEKFGDYAVRYARETYRKWRLGEVRQPSSAFSCTCRKS